MLNLIVTYIYDLWNSIKKLLSSESSAIEISVLAIILIFFLIFVEDRLKKRKLGKMLTLTGIIILIALLFMEFEYFNKDDIFQDTLNLITILVAVYLLDLVYDILKKEIRLGIECLDIPKNIDERGFTRDFVVKEIRLAISSKLEKNENMKELSLMDIANQQYDKSTVEYLKNFPVKKISEIRSMNFFNLQLPELKSKPISKLELSFGEDKDHLHVLASLDGKAISEIIINDSKDDFYDKFKEWIDEFSEVLFLNVIPPCLRLYYLFKSYKNEIIETFEETKNKECYGFNDIFEFIRNQNRDEIGKSIEDKKKVLETLENNRFINKHAKLKIDEVKKRLDDLLQKKELSKVLEIKEDLNYIAKNSYKKDELEIENLKNQVMLSNFLDYLKIDCEQCYCKNCNEFTKEVRMYNKKYCKNNKAAKEITSSIKSYLILLRIDSLIEDKDKDKELEELDNELKELGNFKIYLERFFLNSENGFKKNSLKIIKRIKELFCKSKKEFKRFINNYSIFLKGVTKYRYRKSNKLENLFKSPKGIAEDIQRACVELYLGEWKKTKKLLEKYEKDYNKISQIHENLAYAYYNLEKYEKCIERAQDIVDIKVENMYSYLKYKGCSLYRMRGKKIRTQDLKRVKGFLNNYKEIINGKHDKKYGEKSEWRILKLNSALINFEIDKKSEKIDSLKLKLEKLLEDYLKSHQPKIKKAINKYVIENIEEEDFFQDDSLVYLLYNLGVINFYQNNEGWKDYFKLLMFIEVNPRFGEDYKAKAWIYSKLKDCNYYLKKEKVWREFEPGENIDFYSSACLKLGLDKNGNLIVADHNYKFKKKRFQTLKNIFNRVSGRIKKQ